MWSSVSFLYVHTPKGKKAQEAETTKALCLKGKRNGNRSPTVLGGGGRGRGEAAQRNMARGWHRLASTLGKNVTSVPAKATARRWLSDLTSEVLTDANQKDT